MWWSGYVDGLSSGHVWSDMISIAILQQAELKGTLCLNYFRVFANGLPDEIVVWIAISRSFETLSFRSIGAAFYRQTFEDKKRYTFFRCYSLSAGSSTWFDSRLVCLIWQVPLLMVVCSPPRCSFTLVFPMLAFHCFNRMFRSTLERGNLRKGQFYRCCDPRSGTVLDRL